MLEIDDNTTKNEIIERTILCCVGNFNYWEEDNKISWPKEISGITWFEFVMGRRSIQSLNLWQKRLDLYNSAKDWISKTNFELNNPSWWNEMNIVFGNDPLKKRETLAYIILTDLGFECHCPNVGCIDYNIIVALRRHGIITGYDKNYFEINEETQLRYECLLVCYEILKRVPQLTVSTLDILLYDEGRRIRHNEYEWERYFPYRFGCYYF